MGSQTGWLTTIAIVVLAASGATAASTPEQKCQQAKAQEAGKYDSCRLKAEAKYATSPDGVKYAADLAKCEAKFQPKWWLAENKATSQGGACPSVGDQAAIQGIVDAHTSNIEDALGGGVLQDCPSDLSPCSSDLATCQNSLTTCTGGPTAKLLRTGQTSCYNGSGTPISCAGTGHDGELQKGLSRSYTDNGDGTVTDNKTGLMWEKISDDGGIHDKDTTYSWTDAIGVKIATLNSASFAGYTDWRLPSSFELQSLVSYGTINPSVASAFNAACVPSCSVSTCSCTALWAYWSSTLDAYRSDFAWWVDFSTGAMNSYLWSTEYNVRGVRGG